MISQFRWAVLRQSHVNGKGGGGGGGGQSHKRVSTNYSFVKKKSELKGELNQYGVGLPA